MRILNIVSSPRGERSVSTAIIDSFLLEYRKKISGLVVDTLDVWRLFAVEGVGVVGASLPG